MSVRYEMVIPLISAIVALVAGRWIYFKILRIAKLKNLVDNPDARKLQKTPIPVMGGIVVFFGMIFGLLTGCLVMGIYGVEYTEHLVPIICAMIIMLYIGAMDDIVGLTAGSRFVIESLVVLGLIFASGACVDSFHGLWNIDHFSWWIAVPLTVFAGIGIINAINMIDGVNGLSSISCIVWSSLFGLFYIYVHDISNAIVSFSMAFALLPFAVHNIFGSRSRMFIGDAGTMIMGMLLFWFTLCLFQVEDKLFNIGAERVINPVAMALAILALPIFDTIRVMVVRIIHQKNPFSPDKTHLHHVFVAIGVSHVIITLCEVLIELLIVTVWVASLLLRASLEAQLYIVVLSSIIFVWGIYLFLHYQVVHHTELLHYLTNFSVRTHIGRMDRWIRFSEWLDSPEKTTVPVHYMPEIDGGGEIDGVIDGGAKVIRDNKKEQDRSSIIGYMKGRAEVMVFDIIKNSGADRLRVYPIIFEETQNGRIRVIKENELGAPLIVSLVKE